ncbi:cysteine-rich and transmembrane domain-containing protein 1-like isoform X3 [Xenia sp. Carnegie-2017]|uniref:cysteine-rich and transmembrane domain-containing protein 1-like isoform X3 n=1 Tax=Xenia sp. Carnegie-2017 TaxID=2897299 RepID=UPI001F040055|nr:cysteine-rich and transmembrane domain-containing protein 1-like isoform X3 [Xenia sp. Carnegie-2017]
MEQPPPYSNQKENPAPHPPQQQEPLLGEHTEKHPPQGYPPQGYPAQGYPPQGYPLQQLAGMTQEQQNTTVLVQKQPQTATVVKTLPILNDYMGLSVFACLFCCWPVGIFAIIKSRESRNHYNAGNYDEAMRSAKTARNLAVIAIICGIILFCGLIIVPLIFLRVAVMK